MNSSVWKIYKSKVLKTFTDQEEEEEEETTAPEEEQTAVTPSQAEDGSSTMSQLAKKMQGAGAKGWKSMASLFNREDEHKLLASESSPHTADHPLAVKPEEPHVEKRSTGFWDTFAVKWQQASAMKAGEESHDQEIHAEEGREDIEERHHEESNNSTNYKTLEGTEDSGFKWNFVTSKLAELKNKSMAN
ncbi:uncharacterized protein C1orf232 [Erpetoichthys calabaricus]|uniref:uncharacterized protein C1orf232 n=1 Tax=Erpetoichthys calabaricus TaxID=27687 RepID=UPI00109EF6FF|nr:uncharacterized protein C1orf232 [Erpetoichthys calabaricus]